jgi:hypothetical protein
VRFFETIAEPSTERLRLFGLAHEEVVEGRAVIVSHLVSKNVFTAFDMALSRYLAAVTGQGLPQATVETRLRDAATGRSAAQGAPRHVASAPAALAIAARLAIGNEQRVGARLGNWCAGEDGLGREQVITAYMVEALEHALGICGRIGAADFLEISGDLERVVVRPAGAELAVLTMDLARGTVAVPGAGEVGGTIHGGTVQVPLFGFDEAAQTMPAVNGYLGRARHAVAVAREAAIADFRAAAEERIMAFDAALANRPLTGHRLEAASSLVARLQAVLGDALAGLSEAARITALDWASLMACPAAACAGSATARPRAALPQLF